MPRKTHLNFLEAILILRYTLSNLVKPLSRPHNITPRLIPSPHQVLRNSILVGLKTAVTTLKLLFVIFCRNFLIEYKLAMLFYLFSLFKLICHLNILLQKQ